MPIPDQINVDKSKQHPKEFDANNQPKQNYGFQNIFECLNFTSKMTGPCKKAQLFTLPPIRIFDLLQQIFSHSHPNWVILKLRSCPTQLQAEMEVKMRFNGYFTNIFLCFFRSNIWFKPPNNEIGTIPSLDW